jgi:hypothetical protein
MHARRILLLAGVLGVLITTLGVRPASAQPAMMKRGVENMLMAPLDAIVSPYTTWITLDQNLESLESTGGKVATGIVGYPYTWFLYLVLAGFREAAGIVELPIGLALWPVDAIKPIQLSPFFDSSEAPALGNAKTSVLDFKFGGRWLSTR